MTSKIVGEFDILPMSKLGHKITGVTLTIGTRKHPTPQKPQKYLLLTLPSGKSIYISSLYPDPQNRSENPLQRYSMDYQRIWYTFTMDLSTGTATITPLSGTPQNCANSINNAQLGSKSDPKLTDPLTIRTDDFFLLKGVKTIISNPQNPSENDKD